MEELYYDLSKIYDKLGVSDYSITLGKSILKFFNEQQTNEDFNKNLDICSGTGALCNFFKENGIESKGVDILETMINISRSNFPEIEFIQADIIQYETDEIFDFITCTDDALNHITDEKDFEKIIQNVSSWLREGGYFIFDLNLARLFPRHIVKGIDENSKLTYTIDTPDEETFHYKIRYYENDEIVWEHDFNEHLYNTEFVIKVLNDNDLILEKCGQEFYDDLRHEKLKFIARKGRKSIFPNNLTSDEEMI